MKYSGIGSAAHFRTAVVVGAGVLLWTAPAHAYLDPATASVILQGLLAGFAGLMVVVRLYWNHLKVFFRGFLGVGQIPKADTEAVDSASSDEVKS